MQSEETKAYLALIVQLFLCVISALMNQFERSFFTKLIKEGIRFHRENVSKPVNMINLLR